MFAMLPSGLGLGKFRPGRKVSLRVSCYVHLSLTSIEVLVGSSSVGQSILGIAAIGCTWGRLSCRFLRHGHWSAAVSMTARERREKMATSAKEDNFGHQIKDPLLNKPDVRVPEEQPVATF